MTPCPTCGQSLAVGVRTCLACGADLAALPPRPWTLPAVERFPRWTLVKPGHRVEAFARATPWGPELLITVDGELFWSHTYRGVDPVTFAAVVEAKRAQFEAEGWTPERSGTT